MPVLQRINRVVSMERDGRRDFGRPVQTPGVLHVLDGPLAGTSHTITARYSALGESSFLLRAVLHVGNACQVELNGKLRPCEVVRCRPLSNGKLEIAVAFR